jgi:hypothetical protein
LKTIKQENTWLYQHLSVDPKFPHFKLTGHMRVDEPVDEMNNLEQSFSEIIKARVNANQGKKLKIDKDATFTENPMDRENMEETIEVNTVQSLYEVFNGLKEKGLKTLDLIRVPVVEESAPREACFDILVDTLK